MGREPAASEPPQDRITRPAKLKSGHKLDQFSCGRTQLDDWLKKRALSAMVNNTAITMVVCRGSAKVVGYFALAAGSVEHAAAPGSLRRNSPDPIPVIILARLAVASEERRRGLGKALFAEAMKRAANGSSIVGARALIVHALDEHAAKFYVDLGLREMSGETYYIAMKTIVDGL